MSYYFWINLLSISIPFIVSFNKRLKFHHEWKYLFPAILFTMVVFIPWDIIKTGIGVWGFNPDYLQGIYFFNLPIEELVFFIAIPYACLFTYHSLNYLIKKDYLAPYSRTICLFLIVILVSVALLNLTRTYTVVTFLFTAAFLLLHLFVIKSSYLGRFFFTYMIILVPFFLVNGALTGSFSSEPVVWYDDTRNLGIRLGTIPIEDSVYGLLLLLLNTTIYEWLRNRKLSLSQSSIIIP